MNEWESIKGAIDISKEKGRVGRRFLFCKGVHERLISVTPQHVRLTSMEGCCQAEFGMKGR